jgi:hypothetical protein
MLYKSVQYLDSEYQLIAVETGADSNDTCLDRDEDCVAALAVFFNEVSLVD